MPFDDAWSYGDALFIIDPWLWLALGGAAALGGARTRGAALAWAALAALAALPVVLSGMVPPAARGIWVAGSLGIALASWRSGSAAARGTPGARTALPRALTGAAVLYVGAMVGLSRAAEADVEEALRAAGMGVGSVKIQPLPANPLASEVVVRTPARYVRGSHRWTRAPRVVLGEPPPLPGIAPEAHDAPVLVERARAHPDVAHYLVWARFPYWRIEPADTVARVRVGDGRYTARTGSLSGLAVALPRRRTD